jgi:hypothetical protein
MPFDPVSIRSAGFYGYQHTATTARNDFNFFIFPNVILLLYIVTFFTSKKVTKEGGSYSQALPPMDGRYLKNAGAVFYRLLCALRQKRRCGTRRQKTLLKQSSLNPFLTPVLDCSKALACASRNLTPLN